MADFTLPIPDTSVDLLPGTLTVPDYLNPSIDPTLLDPYGTTPVFGTNDPGAGAFNGFPPIDPGILEPPLDLPAGTCVDSITGLAVDCGGGTPDNPFDCYDLFTGSPVACGTPGSTIPNGIGNQCYDTLGNPIDCSILTGGTVGNIGCTDSQGNLVECSSPNAVRTTTGGTIQRIGQTAAGLGGFFGSLLRGFTGGAASNPYAQIGYVQTQQGRRPVYQQQQPTLSNLFGIPPILVLGAVVAILVIRRK